jgi:hypothetical protein
MRACYGAASNTHYHVRPTAANSIRRGFFAPWAEFANPRRRQRQRTVVPELRISLCRPSASCNVTGGSACCLFQGGQEIPIAVSLLRSGTAEDGTGTNGGTPKGSLVPWSRARDGTGTGTGPMLVPFNWSRAYQTSHSFPQRRSLCMAIFPSSSSAPSASLVLLPLALVCSRSWRHVAPSASSLSACRALCFTSSIHDVRVVSLSQRCTRSL